MRKRMILIWLLVCTALTVGQAMNRLWKKPFPARFEKVARGDVHQVTALTGRIAYAGETIVAAETAGVVRRVCAEEGQRIEAGGMLICLDSTYQDLAMKAAYENSPEKQMTISSEEAANSFHKGDAVIRTQQDCTVRQVLVQPGMKVSIGTPVARVSSHQQMIECSASADEAGQIGQGMWAWISSAEDKHGIAVIQEIVSTASGYLVNLLPQGHIDLPEGTAVNVEVFHAGSDDVLTLPVEAITPRGTVWWVNEGRCTEIPAQIVLCDEKRAWVELPEGITVAIGEFEEGQRVEERL